MIRKPLELEGTWEEIVAHADELAGRKVRLIILSSEANQSHEANDYSSASSLLKYAGRWTGDDLEELLNKVRETRSQAKF